jgi:hypothetical protein
MEIEWREPPKQDFKQGHGKGRVQEFADELKKRPGMWAAYRSVPKGDEKKMNGTASWMKKNYNLEVTVRIEDDDKTVTLFARWPKPGRKKNT